MSFAPFEQPFAHSVYRQKYAKPGEEWADTAKRVTQHVMGALHQAPRGSEALWNGDTLARVYGLIESRMFVPGGRYLYAAGNDFHQVQNCLLLRAEDSREGWANLAHKSFMALMTGAGLGVYYGDVRASGERIKRTGGVASGPVPLAVSINEQSRAAVQGGDRRAALWAGLLWSHADVFDFIRAKDWPQWLRDAKANDPSVAAPLDMTNISVCLDDLFFECYHSYEAGEHLATVVGPAPDGGSWHAWAKRVYEKTVDKMLTTGEPGFSVDTGDRVNEKLRNACTEITSEDDSDICNLGALNLARFHDVYQFGAAVRDAVLFLTAGTLYSDVPYEKVDSVRSKNRRLGLSLMGVHEFAMLNGVRYGSDDFFELLDPYMTVYDQALTWANEQQDMMRISLSVAATCSAPVGTGSIIGETSSAWEPVPAAAYVRALRHSGPSGDKITYQYVVDPTVRRCVEAGTDPATVEDAHTLATDVERRLKVQAYAQSHIDQGIAMTINLPHQMFGAQEQKDLGDTLIKYLPELRGITMYPNGARAGQPITPVPLEDALGQEGVIFEEMPSDCAAGVCAI